MNKYENIVKEILESDILEGIKAEDIKMEDELVGDLGLDSIKFMGLFSILEERFEVPIISSDKNYIFFSIITVKDLVDAVQMLLI